MHSRATTNQGFLLFGLAIVLVVGVFPKTAIGEGTLSNDEEVSRSGAPIFRHKDRDGEWEAPAHENRNLDDIERHVETQIGSIETVLHELVSDLIHLDILYVAPQPDRPYHVLITSGMSDLAMSTPTEYEEYNRAELLIVLPESWPISDEAFGDEANYWPIRWLKKIGRLPHEYDTWIGWGHTIPNSNPPEKIADTDFVGVVAYLPSWLPPEFFQLKASSGDVVSFYQLVPLYLEEMDLKLNKGMEELEERMDKADIGFVIDPNRRNVAKRKKWFGR